LRLTDISQVGPAVQPHAVRGVGRRTPSIASPSISTSSSRRARAAPTGRKTVLVPCYSDLVAALRGRAGEFHGALTARFARLLSGIFVRRITASGVAAELVIRSATPSVVSTTSNATFHLELDAAIAPPR
jgi:hypothetical protein